MYSVKQTVGQLWIGPPAAQLWSALLQFVARASSFSVWMIAGRSYVFFFIRPPLEWVFPRYRFADRAFASRRDLIYGTTTPISSGFLVFDGSVPDL